MSPPTHIDRAFGSLQELCSTLRQHYWRRAPVLVRNHGLGEVFGDGDSVLAGLRSLRRLASPPRTYFDRRLAPATDDTWCAADDASLEHFVARLGREHGSADIALVVENFERTDERLWFQCVKFLTELYQAVGVPRGEVQLQLFTGAYGRTPFGFHKDVADVLTYQLSGHKRYLIWDFDLVARTLPSVANRRCDPLVLQHFDYERLRASATVLEAQPGDLLYWPWDCFHVAEPVEREFSTSLALGLEVFGQTFSELDRSARHARHTRRDDAFALGEQPDVLAERVDEMRLAFADPALLEPLRGQVLFRRTRFGFRDALPRVNADVQVFADADLLLPPLPNLIAWQVQGEQLLVSVNGHGFSADRNAGLIELLTELNRGLWLRVDDLRSRFCASDGMDDADLDALLRLFLSFRAVRLAAAESSARPRRTVSPPEDLFARADLFPLRLVDNGSSVLLAPIADEQHKLVDGFETKAWPVSLRRLLQLYDRQAPTPRRARYVLTAGYSGSTFLCRCIDAMPQCRALYEPLVLSDWSLRYGEIEHPGECQEWLRVLEMLSALLFRSRHVDDKVVVKVGPYVQEVMAELLALRAQPVGVHLYTALPSFLANTLKDPRRREDINTVARTPQRARMLRAIGAPPVDLDALSDAQAIAYVWLTDLQLYQRLRAEPPACGLAALDFDCLLDQPARGLRQLADHLGLDLAPGLEQQIAASSVFARHSKASDGSARAFDRDSRSAVMHELLRRHRAEIAYALRWAEQLWGDALPARPSNDLLEPLDHSASGRVTRRSEFRELTGTSCREELT